MEGKANLISFIPYDIITLFCKVILEVASQLDYARKHGSKYDIINAKAFILEVASQLDYARKHGSKYDIITLFCKGILEVKKQ